MACFMNESCCLMVVMFDGGCGIVWCVLIVCVCNVGGDVCRLRGVMFFVGVYEVLVVLMMVVRGGYDGGYN